MNLENWNSVTKIRSGQSLTVATLHTNDYKLESQYIECNMCNAHVVVGTWCKNCISGDGMTKAACSFAGYGNPNNI